MLRSLAILLVCGVLIALPAANRPRAASAVLGARFPALSPDGQTVVFEYWGDLWAAPSGLPGGAGFQPVNNEGGQDAHPTSIFPARRLTDHLAFDWLPRFSPDGREIAFISDRAGGSDVWVIPAAGPSLPAEQSARRVTNFSGGDELCSWSPDGARIVFGSSRGLWSLDLYSVDAQGKTPPVQLTRHDHYNSLQAVGLPDGGMVYARGGGRWWRKRYRGTSQTDLWLLHRDGHSEQLTTHPGNDEWPMAGADGQSVYYVADQDGIDNIWELKLASRAQRQLTHYTSDGVQWPSIGAGGKYIVFEWNGGLYRVATAGGTPEEIVIDIAGESKDNWQVKQHFDNAAEEFSVSPHGKYLAFTFAGDLWAIKDPKAYDEKAKPDQDLSRAWRVTASDGARERTPAFSPDKRHVAYSSDADGDYEIHVVDLNDMTSNQISDNTVDDLSPQYDPTNADVLFYFSGNRTLVRHDLKANKLTTVAEGWLRDAFGFYNYAVSPDGQWVAYEVELDDWSSEVYIVPSAGGMPVNITRHPEWDGAPRWSADGRRLIFRSAREERRRDDSAGGVYVVDLNLEPEKYDTQFLFEDDRPKPEDKPGSTDILSVVGKKDGQNVRPTGKQEDAKPGSTDILSVVGKKDGQNVRPTDDAKPEEEKSEKEDADKKKDEKTDEKKEPPKVVIDFKDIHLRARKVTTQQGIGSAVISNDGEWVLYECNPDGNSQGVWAVKADGSEAHRIEGGGWGGPCFAADGERVYYQAGGALKYMKYSKGQNSGVETVGAHGDFTLNRRERFQQMFREGWHVLGETFYDQQMHGVDWPAVYKKYSPLIAQIATPEEFELIFSEMLGELNASHLGIGMASKSFTIDAPRTCHIGLEFDESFAGPGLKVSHVTKDGPADQPGLDIQVGDVLLSVEDQPVGRDIVWQPVLDDRMGLPTRLKFAARDGTGGAGFQPVSPDVDSQPSDANHGQDVRATDTSQAGTPAPPREVVLKPCTYEEYQGRLYREWELANEAKVAELSGGRIGYIHIRSMSGGELRKFEREFLSEFFDKDALIVDVRFNPGGFIHEELFELLDRNPFGYSAPRGGERTRQPAHVFDKPKALLINARSGSDAEIFPAGWRQLKLGPVIGVDTAGAVIGTSGFTLIDGTSVRLPIEGWWELDGRNLEQSGTKPDIYVQNAPDDLRAGKDAQLAKAVEVLMAELPAAAAP